MTQRIKYLRKRKENLAALEDEKLQALFGSWLNEPDPGVKKRKREEGLEYWSRRRYALGFGGPLTYKSLLYDEEDNIDIFERLTFCNMEHGYIPALLFSENENGHMYDLFGIVSRFHEICMSFLKMQDIDYKQAVTKYSLNGDFNVRYFTDNANSGNVYRIVLCEFPFNEADACDQFCLRAYIICDEKGNERKYITVDYDASPDEEGGVYNVCDWRVVGSSLAPLYVTRMDKEQTNEKFELPIVLGFCRDKY